MTSTTIPRRAAARAGRGRRTAAAVALLLTASLALAGCGASSSSGSDGAASKAVAPGAAAPDNGSGRSGDRAPAVESGGTPTAGSSPADTKGHTPASATYLVRTATLSVGTPHVAAALDRARQYAVAAGGYTGDEDTTVDSRGHVTSSIQLRVPPAAYDDLLTRLAGLGHLLGRKVSVQDVTEQVVDVQSRIASQRASVARVRALMNRATTLSDVVSLEGELSTRESALEALEAQQASLRSRTDLATITLRLSEPPAKQAPPKQKKHDGFWGAVGHALGEGWHGFYVTMRVLLVVLALVLPFVLAAALVALAYRRFAPTRRRWVRTAPAGPPLAAPTATPEPTEPAGPRLPPYPKGDPEP